MPLQFSPVILRDYHFSSLRQRLFESLDQFNIWPSDSGARILVKPNLNANMNALTGNTTDLRLLAAIIGYLKARGYRHITLGEGTNSGYYRAKIGVIERLMVDRLARHFDVELIDFNYAPGRPIDFEQGETAMVAAPCLESDFFVNVPKLKTHSEALMSGCLKNLVGCLVGQESKKKTHQSLAANICNINVAVRPHLHIVDALVAMEGLGPTRGTPVVLDSLIIGTDPFVIDWVLARIMQFDPQAVPVLAEAEKRGQLDEEKRHTAESVDVSAVSRPFAPPQPGRLAAFIHHPRRQKYFMAVRNAPFVKAMADTALFGKFMVALGLRQDVFISQDMRLERLVYDPARCTNCGQCLKYCPLGNDPRNKTEDDPCLGCLYCFMVCPHVAYTFEGEMGFLEEQMRQYDHLIRAFETCDRQSVDPTS
ncbi:DUF362 domain-containing protein [Desulfovibrio inopinatus]|uniref:DUF362 domain-containing protein n=1 Tax=Desulfovibrio inopinatus TaxID=102109 RepID=UPI0006868C4A|nr:DUF362 domain-containing protein [Desulfovibrio inopinatus]